MKPPHLIKGSTLKADATHSTAPRAAGKSTFLPTMKNRRLPIVLLLLIAVVGLSLLWRSTTESRLARAKPATARPGRNTNNRPKVRSSKAIEHLLRAEDNVEAPVEDRALVAMAAEERTRRDAQEARLVELALTKFNPLFKKLESLTEEFEKLDPTQLTEAKLAEFEMVSRHTLNSLDEAIDATLADPVDAALSTQVDEQFERFQRGSYAEREVMLPGLQKDLDQLLSRIAARALSR